MRKFLKGFYYAYKGIKYAFNSQVNFQFQILAAAIVLNLGYYIGLKQSEWFWIITAIVLVLAAELINTAIEILVDLVSPSYNIKAGSIKDLSAAAVLLTSILAAIIGLTIFIPKFF